MPNGEATIPMRKLTERGRGFRITRMLQLFVRIISARKSRRSSCFSSTRALLLKVHQVRFTLSSFLEAGDGKVIEELVDMLINRTSSFVAGCR